MRRVLLACSLFASLLILHGGRVVAVPELGASHLDPRLRAVRRYSEKWHAVRVPFTLDHVFNVLSCIDACWPCSCS